MKSILALFPKFSSKCSNGSIYMNIHRWSKAKGADHDLVMEMACFSHRFFFTGRKFLKQQKLNMMAGNSSESFQVSKKHRLGPRKFGRDVPRRVFVGAPEIGLTLQVFIHQENSVCNLKWETDGIGKPNF